MFTQKSSAGTLVAAALVFAMAAASHAAPVAGGTLDPLAIPQFTQELTIPPVMPAKGVKLDRAIKKLVPYYEIEVVQFNQQILPPSDLLGNPLPPTTVWSYAAVGRPETRSYPAWTIENLRDLPSRIKWVNNLKDPLTGNFLPHLLPVDQTLHWANPPRDCIDGMGMMMPGMLMTDCRGQSREPYTGPVPIITHVHGAHVQPNSDGYPEAWYLPAANNIPMDYATEGSLYDDIFGGSGRGAGYAVFQYPNDQRSTTLWYHDHSLGMTRTNVYAGPAGFFMVRELSDLGLGLPGPAPLPGMDPNGDASARKLVREIPIVIQDKSFNADGSLFYPGNRAFFEGLNEPPAVPFLDVPFIPQTAADGGRSDVSPLWNPEFFGNTMVVNGKAWPYLTVEQRRYRFRFLNGSDSRFLILQNDNNLPFWQIGSDGGFLPAPVQLGRLLIAPAERADVIVDFSAAPAGTEITLLNLGPDEPFGGGEPGVDFNAADPDTTGKVLKFIVVARKGADRSRIPASLRLPAAPRLGAEDNVRRLSLNEDMSMTVCTTTDADGNVVAVPCASGEPFGPTSARLGILDADGNPAPKSWMEDITENPALGATEIWEIYNFTADAHPIHVHLVQFEVVDRQDLAVDAEGIAVPPATLVGAPRAPEAWEAGTKDTVIVYPGTVTRLKARFDMPGLFVWHCHILSHEDNEMMRPYCIGGQDTCPEQIAAP